MPYRVTKRKATAQRKADRNINLSGNLASLLGPAFWKQGSSSASNEKGGAVTNIGLATGADTQSFWVPWSSNNNGIADGVINLTFVDFDNLAHVHPSYADQSFTIPKDVLTNGDQSVYEAQRIIRTYSSFAPRGGFFTGLGNFFFGREDVTVTGSSSGRQSTARSLEQDACEGTRGLWNAIYFGADLFGGTTHTIGNRSFPGWGKSQLIAATSDYHDVYYENLSRGNNYPDNKNMFFNAFDFEITGSQDIDAWHANLNSRRINFEFIKIVHVFGGGSNGVSIICEYQGSGRSNSKFETSTRSTSYSKGSDSLATKVGTKFYFMFRFFSDKDRWNHSHMYFNHIPANMSFPSYILYRNIQRIPIQDQDDYTSFHLAFVPDQLDKVLFSPGPYYNDHRMTPQCMYLGNTYDFNAIDVSIFGITNYRLDVAANIDPESAQLAKNYRLGGHTVANFNIVNRPAEQPNLNDNSFFVNPGSAQRPGVIKVTQRGNVFPGRYKIPDSIKEADIKPISGKRQGFLAASLFYIEKGKALYEAWGKRPDAAELEPFKADTIKALRIPQFYRDETIKASRFKPSAFMVAHLTYFYDYDTNTVEALKFSRTELSFLYNKPRGNTLFSQEGKYLDRGKYVNSLISGGTATKPGLLLELPPPSTSLSEAYATLSGMLFSNDEMCIFNVDGINSFPAVGANVLEVPEDLDIALTGYDVYNPFFPVFRPEDRLDEVDGITAHEFLDIPELGRYDVPGFFRNDFYFIHIFNLADGSFKSDQSIKRGIVPYYLYNGYEADKKYVSRKQWLFRQLIVPMYYDSGFLYCLSFYYKEIDVFDQVTEENVDNYPASRKVYLPALVGFLNGKPVDSSAITVPFKLLTPLTGTGKLIPQRVSTGLNGVFTHSSLQRTIGNIRFNGDLDFASSGISESAFEDKVKNAVCPINVFLNYDQKHMQSIRTSDGSQSMNPLNRDNLGQHLISCVKFGNVTYFIYRLFSYVILGPGGARSINEVDISDASRLADIDLSNLNFSSFSNTEYIFYILPYYDGAFDYYRAKLIPSFMRLSNSSNNPDVAAAIDAYKAHRDLVSNFGFTFDFSFHLTDFNTVILDSSTTNPRVGFMSYTALNPSNTAQYKSMFVPDPELFDINSKKRVFYFSEYYFIDVTKGGASFNLANYNIEYKNKYNANVTALNTKLEEEYPGLVNPGDMDRTIDLYDQITTNVSSYLESLNQGQTRIHQGRYNSSLIWGVDPSSTFQSYRLYAYSIYNHRVAFISDESSVTFTEPLENEITLNKLIGNIPDQTGYLSWFDFEYLDILSPDFNGLEPFEIIPPSEDKGFIERLEERDIVPKDGVYNASDTGVTDYLSAQSSVYIQNSGGFLARGSFWGLYEESGNKYLSEYSIVSYEGPGAGTLIPEVDADGNPIQPGSPGQPGPIDPTGVRERDTERNNNREDEIDNDINNNYVPSNNPGDPANDRTIIKNYVDANVPNYVTYDKGELVKSFIQLQENGTMIFNRGIFILPSEDDNPTLPNSSIKPLDHHVDNFRLCVVPSEALTGGPLYVGLEEEPITINIGTSFTRWAVLGISRNVPSPYVPSLDLNLILSYSDGNSLTTTRPPHPLDALYRSEIVDGQVLFHWYNYHNIFRFFEAARRPENYYIDHWCTYLINGDITSQDLPIPSFRSKDMYATEANFKDFQYISDSYPLSLDSYTLDRSLLPNPQYTGGAATMLRLMPGLRKSSLSTANVKEWPRITYRHSSRKGGAYYVSAAYPRMTKGYYDSDPVTNPTVYEGFLKGQYFTGYYHHDMYDADDAHLRPTTFLYACIKGARLNPGFNQDGSDVSGDINRYKMQLISDTDNSYKSLIQRVLPGLGYILRLNALTDKIELVDVFTIKAPVFIFNSDNIIMNDISYDTARQNSSFIFENEDMLRGDNTLEEFRDAEVNALEQGRYIVFNSNAFLLGSTVNIPIGTWTCPYEKIADQLSKRQDRYTWESSNFIFIDDDGNLGGPAIGDWVRVDSELIPNANKSVVLLITSKSQTENTTQFTGIHFTN